MTACFFQAVCFYEFAIVFALMQSQQSAEEGLRIRLVSSSAAKVVMREIGLYVCERSFFCAFEHFFVMKTAYFRVWMRSYESEQ